MKPYNSVGGASAAVLVCLAAILTPAQESASQTPLGSQPALAMPLRGPTIVTPKGGFIAAGETVRMTWAGFPAGAAQLGVEQVAPAAMPVAGIRFVPGEGQSAAFVVPAVMSCAAGNRYRLRVSGAGGATAVSEPLSVSCAAHPLRITAPAAPIEVGEFANFQVSWTGGEAVPNNTSPWFVRVSGAAATTPFDPLSKAPAGGPTLHPAYGSSGFPNTQTLTFNGGQLPCGVRQRVYAEAANGSTFAYSPGTVLRKCTIGLSFHGGAWPKPEFKYPILIRPQGNAPIGSNLAVKVHMTVPAGTSVCGQTYGGWQSTPAVPTFCSSYAGRPPDVVGPATITWTFNFPSTATWGIGLKDLNIEPQLRFSGAPPPKNAHCVRLEVVGANGPLELADPGPKCMS